MPNCDVRRYKIYGGRFRRDGRCTHLLPLGESMNPKLRPSRVALVLGATGDVGRGVTKELLMGGFEVIAASRTNGNLGSLKSHFEESDKLHTVVGNVAREDVAGALWQKIAPISSELDVVVAAVGAPDVSRALLDWTAEELLQVLDENLLCHFVAAKTFLPRLAQGGMYISIGGGLADFTKRGFGHLSIGQAAQRMMIRALAKELDRNNPKRIIVKELMLFATVGEVNNNNTPKNNFLTPTDVAKHVRQIVEQPELYGDTILNLGNYTQ
jgi:NAD(P)-dependent dehydrogenase (short-subunit alcohol dehydrogenase family)